MWITISSLGIFLILVSLLTFLRIRSKGRFTVETREIVAAIVVVGLGLFVSGEIKEIAFGDIHLVRSLKEAADKSINDRVAGQKVDQITENTLQFEEASTATKGPATLIPRLIETKASALSFQLGGSYYVASVVAQYLTELTKAPYLKYLVFNNRKGELVGIADARAIAEQFEIKNKMLTPQRLTDWIEKAEIKNFRKLPGYIGAEEALSAKLNTREALSKLLEKNVEKLPVIDEAKHFVGMAYRAQLMGNILVALSSAEKD